MPTEDSEVQLFIKRTRDNYGNTFKKSLSVGCLDKLEHASVNVKNSSENSRNYENELLKYIDQISRDLNRTQTQNEVSLKYI